MEGIIRKAAKDERRKCQIQQQELKMSELCAFIGKRIRGYRKLQGLSQMQLAEKSGLHPAYIGQLERGEKNATLESIQSICQGLQIPIDQFFSEIRLNEQVGITVAEQINTLVNGLSESEQLAVYNLIFDILKLKN